MAGLWRIAVAGRIPQVAADQVVAFGRHVHRAGRQRIAVLIDARAVLLGKDAEIADEMIGRVEAVDVDDLGDEDGGGGLADAGDGDDLDCGPKRADRRRRR